MGCDRINIEELCDEYPDEVFDRHFMCRFIDDALSVFKFQHMARAGGRPELLGRLPGRHLSPVWPARGVARL